MKISDFDQIKKLLYFRTEIIIRTSASAIRDEWRKRSHARVLGFGSSWALSPVVRCTPKGLNDVDNNGGCLPLGYWVHMMLLGNLHCVKMRWEGNFIVSAGCNRYSMVHYGRHAAKAQLHMATSLPCITLNNSLPETRFTLAVEIRQGI